MASTDGRRAALGPLVEAARPEGGTPPCDLRRTTGATVRRHGNGARWRAVPAGHGPRRRAARPLVRRARPGVRERLLGPARERGVEPGAAFLDGAAIGAHAEAAGAPGKGAGRRRDRRGALGRSRGGSGAEARVVADGRSPPR